MGNKAQETAETRRKSLKKAKKRTFLHLPSPALPKQQGFSASQDFWGALEIPCVQEFTASAGSRLPALDSATRHRPGDSSPCHRYGCTAPGIHHSAYKYLNPEGAVCSCKTPYTSPASLRPSAELMNIWGSPDGFFTAKKNPVRAKFKVLIHPCRISAPSSWDISDLSLRWVQKALLGWNHSRGFASRCSFPTPQADFGGHRAWELQPGALSGSLRLLQAGFTVSYSIKSC